MLPLFLGALPPSLFLVMLKISPSILILSKISPGYHCYGGIATIKTATIGDTIECAFFYFCRRSRRADSQPFASYSFYN